MVRNVKTIVNELQVLRAQGGDERAFRDLVQRWSPQLLRFCRRRTDDLDTAREVVQSVWLQVVKGFRRLEDPARFPAWLFTIAARACADQVRGQVHRRTLAAHYKDVALNGQHSDDVATDASVLDLKAAIRTLASDQRQLLSLYYTQGFSIEEIATQLGIPSGTVKSRLHSLREVLHRAHEGEGNDEH
ncbi:sigma-70 family RNA polymerase sigma factor [Parvibaculaceae bacterium PLY_AMNH_Bact1]|nr:sigma-70 family RNA polymerase sigma factor [Parvibaculaceae bacterium PLY_AMNH_Bact1]